MLTVEVIQRPSHLDQEPIQRFSLEQMTPQELLFFHKDAIRVLRNCIVPEGIIYASEDLRFHHKFARDTFISAFFLNEAHRLIPQDELWQRAKKAVINFWDHQLPNGQIPHELKPYNGRDGRRKFYYRNGEYLVNDDSVDATALALIVTPLFIETREEFEMLKPKADKALDWMVQNMNTYDGWLCYKYNNVNGGINNQTWMDSDGSIKWKSIRYPQDPIAAVEVQSYAWKAFRVWADLLPKKSEELKRKALDLKQRFNEAFVFEDEKGVYLAHALDGNGRQIRSLSINPGLALWASFDGESVVDKEVIPSVVQRLVSSDMFDPNAGVSTFANGHRQFDRHRYHSGPKIYWPVADYMAAYGMLSMEYEDEAKKVRSSVRIPIKFFKSFIEQYFWDKDGRLSYFNNGNGQKSCRNQTWTTTGFLWDSSLELPTIREKNSSLIT